MRVITMFTAADIKAMKVFAEEIRIAADKERANIIANAEAHIIIIMPKF